MNSIRLFLFFALGFLLSSVSVFSFAGDRYMYPNKSETASSSAVAQCNKFVESIDASWVTSGCAPSGPQCPGSQDGGSCTDYATVTYRPYGNTQGVTNTQTSAAIYAYCPDSAPQWNGTACVVDVCKQLKGKFDNGGAPSKEQITPPTVNGMSGAEYVYSGDGAIPAKLCLEGCSADFRGNPYTALKSKTGYQIVANPKYDGSSCSFGQNGYNPGGIGRPKSNTPEYDCVMKGQTFGTVNGSVICVTPSSTESTRNKTTTSTNPDGSTTTKNTTTIMTCTGDGACTTSTTNSSTTTKSDGSKTTSSDTNSSSSTGGGGAGDSADKQSFCAENPDSIICKKSQFGGSCTNTPSCTGDAVQCATALAVFKMNCKQPELGDPSTLPNGGAGDPVGEKKVDDSFTYTPLGGSGSCPSPKTFHVGGKVIAFDYSAICSFATNIRAIVILCAWLSAGFIVFGLGGKNG